MADKDSSYQQYEHQTEGGIDDKPPPAYAIPVAGTAEGMQQPFIQQPFIAQPVEQLQPLQQPPANVSHVVVVLADRTPPEPNQDLTMISCAVCLFLWLDLALWSICIDGFK
eukprot:546686_1